MLTEAAHIDAVTADLVELIRQEVPRLLLSGKNWKLVINASASGDVSTCVELHDQRVRKFSVVNQTK